MAKKKDLRKDQDAWIALGKQVKAVRTQIQSIITTLSEMRLTKEEQRRWMRIVRVLDARKGRLESIMLNYIPSSLFPEWQKVFYGD